MDNLNRCRPRSNGPQYLCSEAGCIPWAIRALALLGYKQNFVVHKTNNEIISPGGRGSIPRLSAGELFIGRCSRKEAVIKLVQDTGDVRGLGWELSGQTFVHW